MLCSAHIITKIGFVRRFFTGLTCSAVLGKLIRRPSISRFLLILLREWGSTAGVRIRLAPSGFIEPCRFRFTIRHFVLQLARKLNVTRDTSAPLR